MAKQISVHINEYFFIEHTGGETIAKSALLSNS